MALALFTAAPIPALAGLWECVQGTQVETEALSSVVDTLWMQAGEPGAFGLEPVESQTVQAALQQVNQDAARLSDDSGRIASDLLHPALRSLVTAWPARLHARDDIGNDYAIMGEMGGGGLSRIYHGHDLRNGTLVVIKVVNVPEDLPPGVSPNDVVNALKQEYDMLLAMRDGTAPRVLRLGTLNGRACIVMEHMEGRDLHAQYEADNVHHGMRTDRDVERMLDVARLAAAEIAAVHAQGIVHCDIKPENFMYSEFARTLRPRLRAFDFGIALRPGQPHRIGENTLVLGTPDYMPPETWTGGTADYRRDVFALGGLIYWLVTGRTPFAGASPTAIRDNILNPNFHVVPPSVALLRDRPDLRSSLSPATLAKLRSLDMVVMRALQRNPELRFTDAEQLLQAVRSVISRELTPFARLMVPRPAPRRTGGQTG